MMKKVIVYAQKGRECVQNLRNKKDPKEYLSSRVLKFYSYWVKIQAESLRQCIYL